MAKVPIPNTNYDYDETLSFKDFTNWEFLSRPEYNFKDKVVYSSCFSQEKPDSVVFPAGIKITFINCNLDNVAVPVGSTVIGGSQRRFKVQNDGHDWEIDAQNSPTRLVNYKIFAKFNLVAPIPQEIPLLKTPIDWFEVKKAAALLANPIIE